MATAIIMPRQGQSVESCIITEIFKKPGDKVEEGDLLFAYETDKAAFEEPSTESGTLLGFFFEEGDEVPVLTNVAVIGEDGEEYESFRQGNEEPEAEKAAEPAKMTEATTATATTATTAAQPAPQRQGRIFISPRAKKLANSKGVDYARIAGSGPEGRIVEKDVLLALDNQAKVTPLAKKVATEDNMSIPQTGSGYNGRVMAGDLEERTAGIQAAYSGTDSEIVPLSNIRKLIAGAMRNSLQNSAQLTHHLGADARKMMAKRADVKTAMQEGNSGNITLNDMICYSVVRTLKKHPRVNSHFLGDSLRQFGKVHLGLAVDTERGLMVPVIRNADDLSIQGLSNRMKEVADMCRKGSIDPELLSSEAASFTVSNLGNYGVEMFTPVINLPQSAILGVNTIVPRPKDLGQGTYAFVPYLGLSLTYDHQALDGGEATRFLKEVATEIENIEFNID